MEREKQRKIMATEDRLSNLPESILLHILSLLPDKKQVVRTSVLSKPWRFLWKFVPLSLHISSHGFQNDRENLDFVASTNRELHYWRSFQKICKFEVEVDFWGAERYAKDIDLWVFFATQVANVEDFALKLYNGRNYEFPKFAYKNTSLRNMVLLFSKLNPSCSVSWSSLVSLSIGYMNLNDAVMEKILSGCPNLECLEMDTVWGFHHFEINSEKLRKLIIKNYVTEGEHVKNWRLLEILAPNIQYFQLLGFCDEIRLSLRNVASLTTAILDYKTFGGQDNLEEMGRNFKEILHSVAHVENLELGSWCLQFLSILELKGWQFPASSWKYVKLNTALEQQDFPGICRLLQNSSDIERMVIDWENHTPRIRFLQELFSRFTNETEDGTRFQDDNCDCSLLQLKTIKIIHFHGPLSENKFVFPLVKYLLKKATVLEKLVVACRFEGSNASQDYVEMEQEILSFPRSSPHASAVFSYQ